jgi:hypothetical protein
MTTPVPPPIDAIVATLRYTASGFRLLGDDPRHGFPEEGPHVELHVLLDQAADKIEALDGLLERTLRVANGEIQHTAGCDPSHGPLDGCPACLVLAEVQRARKT